ncbi:MAG: hypothetical protein WBP64_10685 [Nitrososphaeraceae archaeon]
MVATDQDKFAGLLKPKNCPNHVCDAEMVMRVTEDKRKALHHTSFRCLVDLVNYWIGHGAQRQPSRGGFRIS